MNRRDDEIATVHEAGSPAGAETLRLPGRMLPHSIAIGLGAFLLFLVQPLIGRYVLPWFGGGPGVWTTCLLFFQTALLAGYAYAHLLTRRLTVGNQALLHGGLLALALLTLPPVPAADWAPPPGHPSTLRLLGLLATHLGLPFALLAATGPLVQQWAARLRPGESPYRLYALSNAGSLGALLLYPMGIEPHWSRDTQAFVWSAGFVGFVAIMGWCGWRSRRVGPGVPAPAVRTESPVSPSVRLAWLGWPALASALLAATTATLTRDVAAVPLLWIAPLAVYLISFILTFEHPRWYRPVPYTAAAIAAAALLLDLGQSPGTAALSQALGVHLPALFIATLLCHGEVYRCRPEPAGLTRFYLHLAAGGVIGALAVAVVAPLVLDRHAEFWLLWGVLGLGLAVRIVRARDRRRARALAAGAFLALLFLPPARILGALLHGNMGIVDLLDAYRGFFGEYGAATATVAVVAAGLWRLTAPTETWTWNRAVGVTCGLLAVPLAGALFWTGWEPDERFRARVRSFHGSHTVADYHTNDERAASRFLAHGTTTHGIQLLYPDFKDTPTSYYGPASGIGLALVRPQPRPERRIGVLGLGAGCIAVYGRPGDTLRFYEIDPHVVTLARREFTFLADSAAQIEIVPGDGRLSLAAEDERGDAPRFDLLVLDAFSGDAVPVHLLTEEAFALYLQRLAPDGLLVVNLSNRYLDIGSVVEAHAHAHGLATARVRDVPPTQQWWLFASDWILLARQPELLDSAPLRAAAVIGVPEAPESPRWTDAHASLWSVLR